ncbi:type VI secretion system lipoprotein TssJ [Photorhabdus laumondii subsp. laumondii]|uniref:Photorhabdus luminescens subsp. laumondii TTO1 complete genome segment 11/17 n=2 Tax=Photorhabdus laumondii subsp. laumondii TaxID=141679 RepID=Q7MB16_PHOLL|nr:MULTISPECIES: type VI secretion system lipoprotein TssJ [Photorhabdus]AWK42916.1 type VI secretion system-associated lipoprotein [Photorhabdus laumondii subsp. laumondii]AXG43690.1 type VI secretion system lipoprotein TssJ [Photorhabdus laumondii subsp. laumondii]AXG48235.1 type VI secretion system lipoprotein TssJ [Photorhabdus laumondii subsp. laumondii]KTL63659.1 type VI secretion protein [Photorhabdus laumondii subsp. laumondii]MCC8385798.1 type VI secretion system lipoprotein TssJ [Pho
MLTIPFYKMVPVMATIALLLTGCGLTQTVTDGTAAATRSFFHKRVKTLHLDFIPRAAVNTDTGESVALSVPALVRVYQLRDNNAIKKVDYADLLDDGDRILGADCLASEEVVVKPGSHASLDMPMAAQAKYVAVVGLFRNPDVAKGTWRRIIKRNELLPDSPRIIALNAGGLTLLPEKG